MGATINDSIRSLALREQYIELDTGIVRIDSIGDGPAFVIIHSLLTGPEAFGKLTPTLARKHTVHQIYLPGFGGSSPLATGTHSIGRIADVIAETMRRLGCETDTVVLGNGLGAFVTLSLAASHGFAFGPLIASNCGVRFSEERAQAFIKMSHLAETGGMSAVADVAIRRIFPPEYLLANPEAIDERRVVLEAIDPGAFSSACRALAALDLREQLPIIDNPTLVIAGAIDQTTPQEMGAEVVGSIPGAVMQVIPDCGHCPQIEQPEALLRTVEGFLDR